MFWQIMTASTTLVAGDQRHIPAKLYWNPLVSDKKIFKIFYIEALPPGGHVFWRIQMAHHENMPI